MSETTSRPTVQQPVEALVQDQPCGHVPQKCYYTLTAFVECRVPLECLLLSQIQLCQNLIFNWTLNCEENHTTSITLYAMNMNQILVYQKEQVVEGPMICNFIRQFIKSMPCCQTSKAFSIVNNNSGVEIQVIVLSVRLQSCNLLSQRVLQGWAPSLTVTFLPYLP